MFAHRLYKDIFYNDIFHFHSIIKCRLMNDIKNEYVHKNGVMAKNHRWLNKIVKIESVTICVVTNINRSYQWGLS